MGDPNGVMAGTSAGLEEIIFHAITPRSRKFHLEHFSSTMLKTGIALRETKREKAITLKIHILVEGSAFLK